MKQEAS